MTPLRTGGCYIMNLCMRGTGEMTGYFLARHKLIQPAAQLKLGNCNPQQSRDHAIVAGVQGTGA